MLCSIMNSSTKKSIFFWTLVFMFFLTSGSLIAYAFGYRYSFTRGVFIYGGSITLKTTPQEVDVYINNIHTPYNKLPALNSSYHITGIEPGDNYLLEVKAPGYQAWSKRISVHSGISTEFWNIVLTKNSYSREDYDTPGIQRFFISPRKNLAALTEQVDNRFSVQIFDPGTLAIQETYTSDEVIFTDNTKENIEWAPEAHRIIIPIIRGGEHQYLINTLETQETLNLKDIVSKDAIWNVRWDPKTKNAILFMTGQTLMRIDLDSPEQITTVAENVSGYDLSSKGLFYFNMTDGMVYRTNFDGTDKPDQITTESPNMDDNSYQLIAYDEDRIVLFNKSHQLYIYNHGDEDTYLEKLSDYALGSQFSDDGKKLLFWNDREISAYFVRKWEVQPTRQENELMPITRFSDEIKNVQWTRDYEHAVFTYNRTVKCIELDNRDKRNMMDVLSLNDATSILVANFTDGKLYYTEKNDQGQNTMHAIYFPEQVTFLNRLQGR